MRTKSLTGISFTKRCTVLIGVQYYQAYRQQRLLETGNKLCFDSVK